VQSTGAKPQKAKEANPALRYVARQPILSAEQKVYGYELLFRDGVEQYFRATDSDAASRSTLDTSILMGIDILCDGRLAFINCTREVLLKDYITLLPPSQAVVEVLESVPVDDLVIAACQRARAAGYLVALDDFEVDDPREALVPAADIIKVDIRKTSIEQGADLIKRWGTPKRRILAEKVETREEFDAAKKAGFTYFQGYFFRKPELLQAREIPANRLSYLRLLQAITRAEPDPREIEDALKGDTALVYRLLRYLNSPVFGFTREIKSVRHALAMLGEREVCRWIRLAVTLVAAQNKPSDLVLSALVRGRFCELLAPKMKHDGSDLFLIGLLSLMDSILDIPMGLVLEGISVDKETKAVLLGQESQLSSMYDLMLAQEAADWERLKKLSAQTHIQEAFVAECRWEAIEWARQMTSGA
jgi:c-di-GMP-related signal transduction protein